MGRRKIEIQPLTDDRNRTVTFVKRKAGLFKKAHELAVLCQVEIAVIIVGNNNRVYEFSSVDTKELLSAYEKSPKIQESKGPENYGNYKKKKRINPSKYSNMDDEIDDGGDEDMENESDYDSDSPPTRNNKRSYSSGTGMTNTATNTNSNTGPVTTVSGATNASTSNNGKKRPRPPPSHISLNNVSGFNPGQYVDKKASPSVVVPAQQQQQQQLQQQSMVSTGLIAGGAGAPTQQNNPTGSMKVPPPPNSHPPIPSLKKEDTHFGHQRPVLRVQIPIDAKANSVDSAKTITAIDSTIHHLAPNNKNSSSDEPMSAGVGSNGKDSKDDSNSLGGNLPNINTPKFSRFGTFKSPDSRKSITALPLPIQNKSSTSSPSGATAPQLPINGLSSFYGSMPQSSPSSQYAPNSILPTPVLNQVFNQQYLIQQQQQQQQHPHQQQLQQSQHSQASSSGSNIDSQTPNTNPNTPNPYNANANNKFRPPFFTAQSQGPGNGGEQTPISGLPSRYVNDIFPSPSNFYASQDWLNTATGVTPMHSSMPQYFANVAQSSSSVRPSLQSASGAPSGGQGASWQSQSQPQSQSQSQQSGTSQPAPSQAQSQQQPQSSSEQQQQQGKEFQSPVSYMVPFNLSQQQQQQQKKK
ncbi:hypothetical protein CAAN1_08S00760 [[Candida] anglica]|uniref:MADS-box domain-containing protein n=1 Tax=[Candida] anglica TaxID=148631 RepID=A0ABP0E7H9_9ASCO